MADRATVVLVCGGRDYANRAQVWATLDSVASYHPGCAIVQGGARGADALAKAWAVERGHPCFTADAHWGYYGKRAGGLRNGWMLAFLRPDFVIHFPGGTGTTDMVRKARAAGVRCYSGEL